jgi:hypothetical protein
MLLGLVRDGLADVQAETVTAGGQTTEIERVRITAAGRRALEADAYGHQRDLRQGPGNATKHPNIHARKVSPTNFWGCCRTSERVICHDGNRMPPPGRNNAQETPPRHRTKPSHINANLFFIKTVLLKVSRVPKFSGPAFRPHGTGDRHAETDAHSG